MDLAAFIEPTLTREEFFLLKIFILPIILAVGMNVF